MLAGCGAARAGDRPAVDAADRPDRALAEGMTDTGLALFKGLPPDRNVVLSPLGLTLALGIAYTGAAGDTAAEMREALRFPVGPEQLGRRQGGLFADLVGRADRSKDTLAVANSLWLQEGAELVEAFLDSARDNYGATLEHVDYVGQRADAARRINDWVDARTRGRIEEIVEPSTFSALTRMTVLNAVYLDGEWDEPFRADETSDGQFRLTNGDTVSVPMMRTRRDFAVAQLNGVSAVLLPYRGDLAMLAVLPPEGPLRAWERTLAGAFVADLLAAAMPTPGVSLAFPKFTFATAADLRDDLIELGMGVAFDEQRADFRRLSTEKLLIDDVIHKAWIKVDEKGTQAAAATAVEFRGVSAPLDSLAFDRPFLFVIVDRPTGTPIFLGRVADPSDEGETAG